MLFRNRGGLVECGSLRVHVLRIIRHTLDGGLHGTAIQGLLHALHVARELQRGIVTILGRTAQGLTQHPFHFDRHVGTVELGQRIVENDGLEPFGPHLPLGIAQHIGVEILVRRLADQHGEQRGAKRIDIGRFIAATALGKHLRRGPRDGEADTRTPIDGPGDAEIGEHGHIVRVDENIAGLDVSMDDAFAMRGEQRARQIDADGEHLVGGETAMLEERLVIAARSVFEHGVAAPVDGHAVLIDGKNVGVCGDLPHEIRFGTEADRGTWVERVLADFDGHLTGRGKLLVQVHVGFGTGAQPFDQCVAGNLRGNAP